MALTPCDLYAYPSNPGIVSVVEYINEISTVFWNMSWDIYKSQVANLLSCFSMLSLSFYCLCVLFCLCIIISYFVINFCL